MIEGYKSILSSSEKYKFILYSAGSAKEAYQLIVSKNVIFDLALIDLSIPSYEELKIDSGEDVARIVNEKFPFCKIAILTSHMESIKLYTIFKSIKPSGLLVKSEFSSHQLIDAVENILGDNEYFTASVKNCVKEMSRENLFLDNYNRQIIALIGSGVKTKSLPELLHLSLSAIDKRKVQIKDFLGIEKGGDQEIVAEARRQGLI